MANPEIAGKAPHLCDLEPGTHYWCACGKSGNQPYCDGAHQGGAFRPLAFEVAKREKAALCLCKRTGSAPFCDGTHRTL